MSGSEGLSRMPDLRKHQGKAWAAIGAAVILLIIVGLTRPGGDLGIAVGAFAALVTVWAALLTQQSANEGVQIAQGVEATEGMTEEARQRVTELNEALAELKKTTDHLVFLDRFNRVGVIYNAVSPLWFRALEGPELTEQELSVYYDRLNEALVQKGGLHLPRTERLQGELVAWQDSSALRSLTQEAMRELQQPVKSIRWDDD